MNGNKVLFEVHGDRLTVDRFQRAPCGQTAEIDMEAEVPEYRCQHCGAIMGSVGMPRRCRELMDTL